MRKLQNAGKNYASCCVAISVHNDSVIVNRVWNIFLFLFSDLSTIKFLSKPSLDRGSAETKVFGCQYTLSSNRSLIDYAYVQYNEELISLRNLSSSEEQTENNTFTLPAYTFPFIKNASFRCVINIEKNLFLSETTKLYAEPGRKFALLI